MSFWCITTYLHAVRRCGVVSVDATARGSRALTEPAATQLCHHPKSRPRANLPNHQAQHTHHQNGSCPPIPRPLSFPDPPGPPRNHFPPSPRGRAPPRATAANLPAHAAAPRTPQRGAGPPHPRRAQERREPQRTPRHVRHVDEPDAQGGRAVQPGAFPRSPAARLRGPTSVLAV